MSMKKQTDYRLVALLKDVYGFIHPYRGLFFVAIFFRLTSDIVQLFPTWALSRIVDILATVTPADIFSSTWMLIVGWVLALLYLAFGRQIAKLLGYRVAEKAGLDAILKTLGHIYKLDLNWQEAEQSGNKLKRINRGRDGIYRVIKYIFDVIIEALVNTFGIIFIISELNLTLASGMVIFMVTFYIMSYVLIKRAAAQERIVNKQEEELEGLNFESLNNIRTVKALSISPRIMDSIGQQAETVFTEVKKRIFLFRRRNLILDLYFYGAQMAFLVYILHLISLGRAEVGLLVLFINYYWMVGESVWELAEITQELIIAKIWVGRMMDINNTSPVIEDPNVEQKSYPADWKQLTIENVSFQYEGVDALKDVSFTVNRGEKVGIVGLSGAGKSTLFKLLMDLHEDYSGDIRLDSISLKDIERSKYIDHVSVVLQDTELFNITLEQNIHIAGTSLQKNEDMSSVIDMAHLQNVVARLPKGIETVIGEKGFKLSGGERQRVGIARALYRQPDLLLLDEATSHLDVHSEKEIQSALKQFFERVTAIVIAHRLSTVREMDKIVVLESGQVVEVGSFDELIARKGVFAKMWQEQKL